MMDTRQGLAFLFGFGQRFFLEFSDDEPKARLGRNTSKGIVSGCAAAWPHLRIAPAASSLNAIVGRRRYTASVRISMALNRCPPFEPLPQSWV